MRRPTPTPVRKVAAALCALWLSALAARCAFAASDTEPRGAGKLETVVVTGSNILRRIDGETALPIQVITRDDILRSGATSTADLMSRLPANIGAFGDPLSVASQIVPGERNRPGMSSINLRGVGDGSTLVLINGRRVANYAFDGGTVDISSIPLSAIERVEILKDGASAIYGTDAIAGVVNFILRKDYRGVQLTARADRTQHGGAAHRQANALAGYGDLDRDRFNAFIAIDYQKDEALRAQDRPFSRTGYLPEQGLVGVNFQTFPANIQAGRNTILSPALATGCMPPGSIVATLPPLPTLCAADPSSDVDLIPAAERTSVSGRAAWQIDPSLQLFAEGAYSHNRLVTSFVATPVTQSQTFNQAPVIYPAGGPFYPTEFAAANGLTGDLNLRYRTTPLGPRTSLIDTTAGRIVVGAEGLARGWDYSSALVHSTNDQHDHYVSGWVSQQRLLSALASGLVNPFGPSGPEGDALLAAAQVTGDFHQARGSTTSLDARASRELFPLAGGPLAIALGAELRRERLENVYAPIINSGDLLASGLDRQSASGNRRVQALYAETIVPFAPNTQAQFAVRNDRYSDFGSTWNPKLALRWQPRRELMLRGSWGTGFRAPTLYDLYTPISHTFTQSRDDPLRCPVTGAAADCANEFPVLLGGNPGLQPEHSKQLNLGLVLEPVPRLSFTFDGWTLEKKHTIGAIPEPSIFLYPERFGANVVRGPVDPAFPSLPGPIVAVIETSQNTGSLRTSGVDLGMSWRSPAGAYGRFTFDLIGTYIAQWRQQFDGVNDLSVVGTNLLFAMPRWRHQWAATWQGDAWSATLAQAFQSSYREPDATTCDGDGNNCAERRVGTWEAWDLQASYAPSRRVRFVLGIRNLFDRAPPFSQFSSGFQAGYDSGNVDPRSRSYYAAVTVAFD